MDNTFDKKKYPYNLLSRLTLYDCEGRFHLDRVPLSEEQLEGLKKALSLLPKRDRDILMMRFRDKMKIKDIAGALGVSNSYADVLLMKAVIRLKAPEKVAMIIESANNHQFCLAY